MSIEELIPAYAAGELSDEESDRVEMALGESPRLRDELAQYERLFVLLSVAAEEEMSVPDGLEARIARQVALRAYLGAITGTVENLFGAYGRAIVYYLGLA